MFENDDLALQVVAVAILLAITALVITHKRGVNKVNRKKDDDIHWI